MPESTTRFTARDLHGVWVALFTPLRRDDPRNIRNSIDYEKAAEMIEVLLAEGVTGIVPVGTTGQSPTVSPKQHVDFIRFVHERLAGRARMIAGAGSNCTRESIDTIGEIRKVAPEVPFLCVTGYYNNPPQEGIVAHFQAIAAETGASIVLYNVPSRTSSYLQPETVIELAAHPQVIGVKQAVDFVNPGRFQDDTRRIIEETRSLDFAVLSGEDDALAALLRLGGHGIISATANIPEAVRIYLAMAKAHAEGRDGDLQTLQGQVTPFVRWAFCRKNPIPLAAVFDSPVFLPLVSLVDTARGREDWAEMKAFLSANAPGVKRWLGE